MAVYVVDATGRVVVQGGAGTVVLLTPVGPVEVLVEITSLSPMKVEQKVEALKTRRISRHAETSFRFSSSFPWGKE